MLCSPTAHRHICCLQILQRLLKVKRQITKPVTRLCHISGSVDLCFVVDSVWQKQSRKRLFLFIISEGSVHHGGEVMVPFPSLTTSTCHLTFMSHVCNYPLLFPHSLPLDISSPTLVPFIFHITYIHVCINLYLSSINVRKHGIFIFTSCFTCPLSTYPEDP